MEGFLYTWKASPAKLFFQSLIVMKSMMTDSPSCFFARGNVKLRTPVNEAFAIMIMNSSSWSSDPSFHSYAGFAVRCDSWEWMSRFPPSLLQEEDRQLYFYIKRGSKHVNCIAGVGNESITKRFEFCMGELYRLKPFDSESLDLDLHDFSFYLRSECLREVITSVASRYDSVMMLISEKSVSWVSASGELRYIEERNQCRVEGVTSGNIYYGLVEWKGEHALLLATEITDEVLIYAMTDPSCLDWISFNFIVDEGKHFRFVMRGLENQMLF